MSLVRSVLEKYKTHGGLTDTTDTSTSVSSVSDSPRGIQGEKGTSGSSVSESGKGFSDKYSTENKPQKPPGDVLTQLTQGSAGGHYADFDKPEIDRQLNTRHPDADEFPQFAAALQLGRLVLCRRCQHYGGPLEKQLGWCQHHETEAAPDVVSTCRQFEHGFTERHDGRWVQICNAEEIRGTDRHSRHDPERVPSARLVGRGA